MVKARTQERGRIKLKEGREKPVQRRHPWIFSGSVGEVEGAPQPGETVGVYSSTGEFLAWAAFSPTSQIRARIWSWEDDQPVGPSLFRDRIKACLEERERLDWEGTARRLVHGESDHLPGLIVDQYQDTLVLQILSTGMERWREDVVQVLDEVLTPRTIYERSDAEVRKLEGLDTRCGLLLGEEPEELIPIEEEGRRYLVDIREGHKTGFYLDQRENRSLIQRLAKGKKVLDAFCYSGGFSAAALQGGADSAHLIDSSEGALQLAKKNLDLDYYGEERVQLLESDVFSELRTLRDRAAAFDLIILDPPKFAPTASHAQRAARGYKDINLWAFKLLAEGGQLVTFSCSGGIDRAFFQKIVADAALDAGVKGKIIRQLWQAPDHPTGLAYPEGSYLKGFLIQI